MGEIIAVLSGKGGTGKTSFCANTAACLCTMGERVLLIDADAGLRNLDIVLGMHGGLLFSYVDVINGAASLEEASVPHDIVKTLRVLTAPGSMPESSGSPLWDIFDACRKQFTYTLIDCPAGLSSQVLALGAAADRAVVVTTPDAASLRIAQSAAQQLFARGQEACRIAVNRVRKKMIARGEAMSVDQSIDTSGLPLLGVIPEDSDVIACGNLGQVLLLNSVGSAAAAYMNIAKRIRGQRVRLFDKVKL